jgi:NTP pyrophosphatase (non-canonical NTP hydrolase)
MPEPTLKELIEKVMQQAQEKGFGTKPEEINLGEKMALLHAEVAEAYEAYRHKNISGKDGFSEEMGDIIQRVLHLCGIFEIDITAEIIKKLDQNKTRNWDWEKLNETHC